MPLILIGVLAVVLIWVMSTYNYFAATKTRVKASIQEIGNQLKRQSELIPNLEASSKGYLKHEKGIFDKLVEARKAIAGAVDSGNLKEMTEASAKLSQILPKITIAVESNPEIKGSEVVAKLMDELRDTSDKVMYARRTLIDLSADYNVKRVTFPSSLIANVFSFGEVAGLSTMETGSHVEVSSDETKTPKVEL